MFREGQAVVKDVVKTANEVKAIGKEVTGVFGWIASLFQTPKVDEKPIAEVKKKKKQAEEFNAPAIYAEIGKQITAFFKAYNTLKEHIEEEEEKSRTVYDPTGDQTEKAVKSRQKGEAETARANESKGPIRQPTTPTPGTKTPTNVAPVAPVSNKPVKPVVAPIPAGVVKTPIVPAQTSPVKPVVPQGTPTGSPGKTGPGKDLGFKSVPATTSPTVNMNPKPKATAPTTSGTGSSAEQAIQNGAAFLGV